jgi:hypothetical protein
MVWVAAMLVLMQAFWQTKPPGDWNNIELAQFLADSPWAQMAAPPGKAGTAPAVQVYLATAGPIERAVAERNRRVALRRPGDRKTSAGDPLGEEFAVWFADNRAEHIIVAARVGNNNAFSSESEMRRMQQDSALDAGRGRVKMSSYFPPTSSDPHLYVAFPRGQVSPQVSPMDKSVAFELYLPGVPGPFRTVQFKVKDMLVDGKLEM